MTTGLTRAMLVGLVAPHAARALVARHARVLPVAALLGALLVPAADTVGPYRDRAGAAAGRADRTPCFGWLLWRSRTAIRPS